MRVTGVLSGAVPLAVLLALASGFAEEDSVRTEPKPAELQNVGITERLNEQLPLDLKFADETGETVALSGYFRGGRPVLLALVYYRCPMLCNLILNGMAEAMREQKWTAGREYEAVIVSFDPLETPELAAANKERFLERYGRAGAGTGVHFMTGKRENIRALAQAVGFRYAWDEKANQYAHAAAIYVCTPDGKLSRYLYGVEYDPRTLRLGLIEAAEGKIGTVGEQVLMFCYQYDPTRHTYSLSALRLMQVAGAATVLAVGALLAVLWLRELRRRRKAEAGAKA